MDINNIMIGDKIEYVDPIDGQIYDGTIIYMEMDSLGITFIYIKADDERLNIHFDPKFPEPYWMITSDMNMEER